MPAPSQLAIATSSLNRLVKEEASYHKESQHQQERIAKLEASNKEDDENAEYTLGQEVSQCSTIYMQGYRAIVLSYTVLFMNIFLCLILFVSC